MRAILRCHICTITHEIATITRQFTNFELGTRVPLVIRSPVPAHHVSKGQVTQQLAELVDVFPTVAELAGVPVDSALIDSAFEQSLSAALDGTSLAAAFADPSNPTAVHPPTDKGTFNKTAAFSQYPHDSTFSCPFFRDGACFANHSSAAPTGVGWDAQTGPVSPSVSTPAMGFSVRTASWRFTIWLPWDASTSRADWSLSAVNAAPIELYDQTRDGDERENDFDALASANQAYNATMHDVVQHHLSMVTYQFHTLGPKPNPGPNPSQECEHAGGILAKGGQACCAASCGKCGGKGCNDLPGGKTACCSKEVEKKGDSCLTHKAPCVV